MRSLITVTLTALSLSACADNAATLSPQNNDSVTTTTLTDGLHHPWSLAFVSDKEWLITERRGTLRRLVDGTLQDDPVDGVPQVVAKGQGGLFDVMPHPDFADN
ncbi:MAG: PQQ-dependent sugar dehydrogenase, partial [Pseudomonadota bacterium]|nr:PQQ-dependent sugar dehydrogenase [Pseudomonadota bacterium]